MTTQAKHTPGPWTVCNHWICAHDGLYTVAAMPQIQEAACIGHVGEIVNPANARLIASAPALLEALQDLVAINFENHDPMNKHWIFSRMEKARAAIQSATLNQ